MKRNVCVVVASRANYGRIKYLMKAIDEHERLNLQLIVGASTLLERFGRAVDVIEKDGFTPERSLAYVVEGETLETQAKSTGLGIIELSTSFGTLNPDMVVTMADRFETMATAISATYMNIPLIHLQGGEISGNIDDRVRHAITKLADYHFVSSEESKKRVIDMGEESFRVFNYGCPSVDVIKHQDLTINNEIMSAYGGVGSCIDWTKPYLLMIQHPVTTSYGHGFEQVQETLESLKTFSDFQKVVLWPNIDAGSDAVSKGIRVFRENNMGENFHYFKNFSPEHYVKVLNGSSCVVGNSSSIIREGSFLGVPGIIVGDRQKDREHGINIVFADYDRNDITAKVKLQLAHGRFETDSIFGSGNAGELIANELAKVDLGLLKRNSF